MHPALSIALCASAAAAGSAFSAASSEFTPALAAAARADCASALPTWAIASAQACRCHWAACGRAPRIWPAPTSPRAPSGIPTTQRPLATALRVPRAATDCTYAVDYVKMGEGSWLASRVQYSDEASVGGSMQMAGQAHGFHANAKYFGLNPGISASEAVQRFTNPTVDKPTICDCRAFMVAVHFNAIRQALDEVPRIRWAVEINDALGSMGLPAALPQCAPLPGFGNR